MRIVELDGSSLNCPKCNRPVLGSTAYTEESPPIEPVEAPVPPPPRKKKKRRPRPEPAPEPEPIAPVDGPASEPPVPRKGPGFFGRIADAFRPPTGAKPDPAPSVGESPPPQVAGPELPPIPTVPGLDPPPSPNSDPQTPDDDPRRTLKPGGRARVSVRKPSFRLDQISNQEVIPFREIYGSYDAPLYQPVRDPATGRESRHNLIHLRNTPGGLEVRPLDTINGLFVRIVRPMPLADKARFRIGKYLIEARVSAPEPPVKPKKVPGEVFFAKAPEVHGQLVFIRPDGSPGASYPVRREVVIGRGGHEDPAVQIPLFDDDVSRLHARVTSREGELTLFNLSKTSATFLEVDGPTFLDDGDCFQVGELVLQLTRI